MGTVVFFFILSLGHLEPDLITATQSVTVWNGKLLVLIVVTDMSLIDDHRIGLHKQQHGLDFLPSIFWMLGLNLHFYHLEASRKTRKPTFHSRIT